jgi:hypothetical protein
MSTRRSSRTPVPTRSRQPSSPRRRRKQPSDATPQPEAIAPAPPEEPASPEPEAPEEDEQGGVARPPAECSDMRIMCIDDARAALDLLASELETLSTESWLSGCEGFRAAHARARAVYADGCIALGRLRADEVRA